MLSFLSFTSITLVLRTLFIGSTTGSAWSKTILWAVRLVTLSLLFRTFLGPSILRLLSGRLRARSVSLRSIRGIYFRSKAGIWRIDRIGLSYHRPSEQGSSRFSVKVEGLKLEIQSGQQSGQSTPSKSQKVSGIAGLAPFPLARGFASVTRSVLSYTYTQMDPYARPVIRAIFVAVFRFVIRALPTLVQALDFELESAVVTLAADVEARLAVSKAKVDMNITLKQLDSARSTPDAVQASQYSRHKRFASVANLNNRLKNSLKRTWGRAWGATEVAASVSLSVSHITGVTRDPTRDQSSISISERLAENKCLDIPHIAFSVSARVDPHSGIQRHSLETSLKFDTVDLDLDVLLPLLDTLKKQRTIVNEAALPVNIPAPLMSPTSSPTSNISPFSFPRPASPPLASSKSIFKRPTSPTPSLSSMTGWTSPMGVLSASIKFRRGGQQPVRKVHRDAVSPRISVIKAIQLDISKINIKHCVNAHGRAYLLSTALEGINVNASLSHPDHSTLHREWLGRNSSPGDPLTPDTFSFGVSIKETCMSRIGSGPIRDQLKLIALGSFTAEAVVSQWPSPWLRGPTFLAGDPNAQFLLVRINVACIDVTERLEAIQSLLNDTAPRSKQPNAISPSSLPSILSPIPRLQVSIGVGPICARLISPAFLGTNKPFAIEARTDGFVVAARTHFLNYSDKRRGTKAVPHDHPQLQMDFGFNIVLQRTFVNVCGSQWEDLPAVPGLHAGQPLLSLDEVYITGSGNALGDIVEDPCPSVTIDVPSVFLDVSIVSDALSIELWQPDAIGAITTVLQVFHVGQRIPPVNAAPAAPRYILDSLPSGLSVSVALSRIMLFATGPDLSPGEELEISRGIASHIGVAVKYCSLRSSHKDTARYMPSHEQQRLLLSLPPELVSKAHGRVSSYTGEQPVALMQIKAWDIASRDALATRLVADDLFGVGDKHHRYRQQEYLNVEYIIADIVLSGRRQNNVPPSGSKDDCAISVSVGAIQGTLHLANAYNALLAMHTLKSLLPSTSSLVPHHASPKPSTLSFSMTCEVDRLQLVYDCPLSSKVYLRLDAMSVEVSPSQTIVVGWNSLILATSLDVEHDGVQQVEWEEIARLLDWRAVIQPDLKPVGVAVDGHSALIRIPFQFVLADLILDLNVSIKCIKHLLHMVPLGRFSTPPMPPAEDPKRMPDLVVRIGWLTVEAADEDVESRLALIWRAGADAARLRMEREDAFQAKVAAIVTNEFSPTAVRGPDSDYQFSPEHSVPVEEARDRLRFVHSGAWKSRFRHAHVAQHRRQETLCQKSHPRLYEGTGYCVNVKPPSSAPPLCRITFDSLSLHLARPSFPLVDIPEFLHAQGGLPRNTEFSLLIPMHLDLSVSAFRVALREYPLPLLNVPPHSQPEMPGLIFDTDLVIAEEMYHAAAAVEWIECAIVKAHRGLHGASPLSIAVPKTLNPVKTYANPVMRVTTDDVTDLTWGVGYSPAMQDFMRVIDTISHTPRDSSPAIGFWDKLRLVFHWSMKVHFNDEVHLHLKGSRNPYDLRGSGAGFALCWKGHPHILINQPNEQNELIQVISDNMLITIPNIEQSFGETATLGAYSHPPVRPSEKGPRYHVPRASRKYRKVCAKFGSGVRFGIGFVLERACGFECPDCKGSAFHRQCRLFNFRPHYEVMLQLKPEVPKEKSAEDSYNGFRSDFVHLSISLTSSLDVGRGRNYSSIHLSPKLFSHFWAWWTLFDTISLPIRQGGRYKHKRPLSPKFGQHLATIKYRISVPNLFISHAYMDESTDAWSDGVTPFVGTKAMIEQFQADMHQRAQESTITTPDGQTKTIMHKPFVAIEVVLKGLELRALLAIYSEPLKQCVPLECSPAGSAYRNRENIPVIEPDSPWIDLDDFVETDWSSAGIPILHLLPVVSCPRFTYFRRAWQTSESKDRVEISKFDNEDTHVCLLGTEASVPQVQLDLATQRINELYELQENEKKAGSTHAKFKTKTVIGRMITLLEDYVKHLEKVAATSCQLGPNGPHSYYMPSDSVSPEEWAEFNNVYQVHCPQIFMDNIIRDILIQYYYCSVARRGIEYHMATRAVKFIRDQAKAAIETLEAEVEKQPAPSSAQAAAMAVRKMFTSDDAETSVEHSQEPLEAASDPSRGWSEGVFLRKSHFCLLLKPQVLLRSEASSEAVIILAAVQGKLQTYAVMDIANADDPISGKVMTRNFASMTGLQSFSPSAANTSGEGCVPLEVLVDLRCDNPLFDRLVPQTDASMHYDKFNRLRLRNNVMSVARTAQQSDPMHNHLHNQTDLIRFHVPRFTVSANDRHFQAISNIVTDLLLFSNAALKTRSERLEKMLFSYDFTNVSSAADVVADLQSRLRHAVEMKREAEWKLLRYGEEGEVEKLKINAHIHLLSEELDFVFDAIKLAQDKVNNRAGQNSALLLHASSSEISWRMLDRLDQLLAKLAVRDIDFHWLSRQDSSIVNNLAVGDLQAFDGAADAEWTEILSKFEEKSNHPLVKQKLFLLADWTVLPPVGGITIYEAFDLSLHPMSLQIDTRVGKKIMEYVWPARRTRKDVTPSNDTEDSHFFGPPSPTTHLTPKRASFDMPPTPRRSVDSGRLAPTPIRRLNTSRSFTDLRAESRSNTLHVHKTLQRTKSSDGLFALAALGSSSGYQSSKVSDDLKDKATLSKRAIDDAAEMKTRSSQKTFVWVRVSSLHLVLSIMKEDSFLCRDARIKTRDLEYRNQTWSFEELVDQFIPSGKNWKGWVKIAFQQPLVPVLPVARELITKTKWGTPKTHHHQTEAPKRKPVAKRLPFITSRENTGTPSSQDRTDSSPYTPRELSTVSLTAEPEPISEEEDHHRRPRTRVLSLFKRSRSKPRSSMDSDVSVATSGSSHSLSTQSVPPMPSRPSLSLAHAGSEESSYSTQSSVI